MFCFLAVAYDLVFASSVHHRPKTVAGAYLADANIDLIFYMFSIWIYAFP